MSDYPLEVALRDGGTVVIRPIEPTDREALRTAFERLGERSRYRRFLSPVGRLSEAQLDYLTRVDHHDHEALVAVGPGGEGVGVARYVRWPGATSAAEAAVAVTDDWQRRGVGTALLTELTNRAREEGIERLTATVLAENRDVLALLDRLGDVRVKSRGGPTVDVEVELERPQPVELEFELPPGEARGAGLGRALRAAAAGHLRPSGWRWLEESARSLRRRLG